jgi:F420H(2)-dependent quinone reductase
LDVISKSLRAGLIGACGASIAARTLESNLKRRFTSRIRRVPLKGDFAPLDPAGWVAEQIETWERSGGTEGTTLRETGLPIVIVVNRGARTGDLHRTPLMRVEHDGSYLAVGSKGGGPKDPAWVANLRAHPETEVWDGPVRGDFVARELTGDERAAWWERAVAAFPNYADYEQRTERLIPVFVLEPAA